MAEAGGVHERVVAQNGAAAHQGVDDAALEALAFVENRTPGARHHVAAIQGPFGFQIDKRQVGVEPGAMLPLAWPKRPQ